MLYKTYQNHNEIIHNLIWRSMQIFGKQGITFLIFILSAKMLSPFEFGIYNYVIALISLLVIFSDFGISTATSKYVAEYNVTDKEKLKSILFNTGIIIASLTAVISVVVLFFGKVFLGDKYLYVVYLLPLVFLTPITSLYDGIYRGLKKFKYLAIISLIIGLISLSFVYILIKQYGLIGALISQNLFYLLLFLALGFGYRDFSLKINKDVMINIGEYSLFVGVAGLSYFLYTRIDVLILGHFDYIVEIGVYEIVNKVIMLLIIPFAIISQVVAPDITRLYSKGKLDYLVMKIQKYMFFSFLLGLALSFVTFFFFHLVLKMFLPEYYNSTILFTLNILLFIFLFQCVSYVVGNGFSISTGHAKLNMRVLMIFGIINVILDIILIKAYGFNGLIYTKLIVGVLANISFILYYYKILINEEKNGIVE